MEKNTYKDIKEGCCFIKSISIESLDSFFPDTRVYSVIEKLEDDEIFFHGGANKNKEYSQIDIFDSTNLKWKSVAEFSVVDPFFIFDKALAGHTSNTILGETNSKKIVVYGGFDGISYSNALYMIDIENFQFNQMDLRGGKNNEYPLSRAYHSSSYDLEKNELYVFGGWNSNISNFFSQNFTALWKFDFNSLFWEKIILYQKNKENNSSKESTLSLRGHSCNKIRNKLFLFGGVAGFTKFSNNLYEEIDLVEAKGNIPYPRAFHASCSIKENSKNPYLIFYGGVLQSHRVSNEIYLYNIMFQEFILFKSEITLPCLFGHKMIHIKDKLITLGGMNNYLDMISQEETELPKFEKPTCDYMSMKNILIINLIL